MDDLPDIAPFQRRLEELDARMAEPTFYANPRAAAEVTREQQKLRRLVEDHRAHARVERELRDAAELARETSGAADLRELAAAEMRALERRAGELREAVLFAMMPPEPSDSRNTVMEIRAGTGGEEAALFAAELARCYQKYADAQGWKVEPMSSSASERGGLREVAFLIVGTDVYRRLKWESGVHRVQRVPVTEASGRIHTSTVTVAVLPEAEEVDVQIDAGRAGDHGGAGERAGGPGGQHDRLGGADPAQADRPDRQVRRRAVAAQEQGPGHDGAALPPAQAEGGRGEGEVRRGAAQPDRFGRPQRAHPHLQFSAEPA